MKNSKIKKHVILTLEYDLGDFSDIEADGGRISLDPKSYEDSFYQGDVYISEMDIVGVRIKEA
jgi:hypothetical protein